MVGLLILGLWALLIFLWGRPWLFVPVDESELAFEPDDVIAHRLGESRRRDGWAALWALVIIAGPPLWAGALVKRVIDRG